ncbi:MAG: tRNA adenosine(34) deaminase TadA [Pseudomonadales bacterium]|nr:tRNA adenosine(34) deaminase TadA [Pseudomonadales bacterium]
MEQAIVLANEASAIGEVPVGALVVLDDEVIGQGFNRVIADRDPTSHAEIVAMRAAARKLDNYRLSGAALYSTIEPCSMCAGALVHARIADLYFGARAPRSGAVGSTIDVLSNPSLNHVVRVHPGVMEEETAKLLKDFFKARRSS